MIQNAGNFKQIFGSLSTTITFLKFNLENSNLSTEFEKKQKMADEKCTPPTEIDNECQINSMWLRAWLFFHNKYINQQSESTKTEDTNESSNTNTKTVEKDLLSEIIGLSNKKLFKIISENNNDCSRLSIFISTMFRIYVSQLLYKIYIDIDPEIAYQLYLFSISHNELVIYMKEYEIYDDISLKLVGTEDDPKIAILQAKFKALGMTLCVILAPLVLWLSICFVQYFSVVV